MELQISLVGIHRKGAPTFAQIKRKTPELRPAYHSSQSSFCRLRSDRDQVESGADTQVISIKRREQLREEDREAGKGLTNKEERNRAKYESLLHVSADSKGAPL